MLPYHLTTHPLVRRLRRPWKIAQALVANVLNRFPSRKLCVIGVTGTTGKTTTVHLIARALASAGYTVGAFSSIAVQVGTRVEKNRSGLTTVSPWMLQRWLNHLVRAGCHLAVIEVSSHALDQRRLWGTAFDVAVITTLARDHLDYHQTLADYANAKRELFRAVSRRPEKILRGVRVPRVLVAPLDDPSTIFLAESADDRYGITLRPDAGGVPGSTTLVTASRRGGPWIVRAGDREALMPLKLPGEFNVRNALTAIAVGVSQGIEVERITREIADVTSIPGRFERIEVGQPFSVIVDYAVTEAALTAFFSAVNELNPARTLAVFGAAGNRDRGKRANMAAIVGTHADIVFLTDEDPFTEDPDQIFRDLEAGLNTTPAEVRKVPDRREAIRAAIQAARPGDIIVATGKGAEETMRFNGRTVLWDDRQVFREELTRARREGGS